MNTKLDASPLPSLDVGRLARRRRAFTLIELLTVVAIIGVLAAILFPVLSKVRQSARQSACASNLRQIGIALAGYVADHKGYLPGHFTMPSQWGPLAGLQRTAGAIWYTQGGVPTQDLDSQLMDYLNLGRNVSSSAGSVQGICPLFLCPANPSHPTGPSDTKYAPNYYLAPTVRTAAGITKYPFGYSSGTPAIAFAKISNPSAAPALFDLDASILSLIGAGAVNYAPATCVHGSTRNVLYFDGHVAAVLATVNPLEK